MDWKPLPRFERGEDIRGLRDKLNLLVDAVEARTPQPGYGTRLQTIPKVGFNYSATPTLPASGSSVAAWDLVPGTATDDWQLNPGWIIDSYVTEPTAFTINDVGDDWNPTADQVMYLEFDYDTGGPGIHDLTECDLKVGTFPTSGLFEWDTSSPPLIEYMRYPLWSFHDPDDLNETPDPDVSWPQWMVDHGCKRKILSDSVHAIKHAPDWPSLILVYFGTPESGPTSSQMRATPFLELGPIPIYGEDF